MIERELNYGKLIEKPQVKMILLIFCLARIW